MIIRQLFIERKKTSSLAAKKQKIKKQKQNKLLPV
jgi:hypothetical protein